MQQSGFKPLFPGDRVAGFVDSLRADGYIIGIGESSDIYRMLLLMPALDTEQARIGLHSLCCRNLDEWNRFESLYLRYWYSHKSPATESSVLAVIDARLRKPQIRSSTGIAGGSSDIYNSNDGGSSDIDNSNDGERLPEGVGAGRQRGIGKADFRFLVEKVAMRKVEQLAERLAIQLRSLLSRRRILTTRPGRLDIRKTIRSSIGTGGFPNQLIYSDRRKEPCRWSYYMTFLIR